MSIIDDITKSMSFVSSIANHANSGKKVIDFLEEIEGLKLTLILAKREINSLLERQAELTQTIAREQDWDSEKLKYKDHHLPSNAVVMIERFAVPGTVDDCAGRPRDEVEQIVYYCKWCFDQKQRSTLQPDPDASNMLICHGCKSRIRIEKPASSMVMSFDGDARRHSF